MRNLVTLSEALSTSLSFGDVADLNAVFGRAAGIRFATGASLPGTT